MLRVLLAFLAFIVSSIASAEENAAPETAVSRSVVFYAHDDRAINHFDEDPLVVRRMVNALVIAVTGQHDLASAWRTLVKPGDRVGIKISATGGPVFSTHKSVINALVSGLSSAGVPPQQIIVWDRADMEEAGFSDAERRYVVKSIAPVVGYDPKAVYVSPVEGKLMWGDALFTRRDPRKTEIEREQLSSESHWSRVLGEVTKIINVPVLSSSESCGVAGCLYNVTVPNVDNWRRFLQVSNPYLCELYADSHVAPKIVLNLLDGLVAQYAGGPEGQPNYSWRHATLYASKDPVALDSTALRQIEKWRAEAKLPSVAKRASYLQTAELMSLGHFAEERIEFRPVSVR